MTTILDWLHAQNPSLKQKVLRYYFTHPNARHYLRELALLLKLDPANLSRELKKLCIEGIFQTTKDGKQKYFELDPSYPLHLEFKSIAKKKIQMEQSLVQPTAHPRSHVYIIAGPNGAGKTTFAKQFLPKSLGLKTFINADLIAGGIAPLDTESAAFRAGRLLLEEIKLASEKKIDFAFETTLSGKSYKHLLKNLIAKGYAIHVLFLWVPNVQFSIKRVRDRVKRGGHSIPQNVIRRRFDRGIENLFSLYAPLLSSWSLYDNSGSNPSLIAYSSENEEQIIEQETYTKIRKKVKAHELREEVKKAAALFSRRRP